MTVGFLGGLTTFFMFSYETFKRMEDGRVAVAFLNIVTSVAVCLLFMWLGIASLRAMTHAGWI